MEFTVKTESPYHNCQTGGRLSVDESFFMSFPDAPVCLSLTDPMLPFANILKHLQLL